MTDKRISISLTNDTLERLENTSKQFKMTKSQFITLVLDSVLTGSMDDSLATFLNGIVKNQK